MKIHHSLPSKTIQAYHFTQGKRFCKYIRGGIIIGFASIALLGLRIGIFVCKIFRQDGSANFLKHNTRKFFVIHIEHNFAYFSSSPLPLLTYAKNLAKPGCIAREDDVKTIKVMRDLFLAKNSTTPEITEKLQKMNVKGANIKGICFGATHSFLKACLNAHITSEEDLINVAKQYEEGFDAEAAGLQKIYGKTFLRSHTYRNDQIQKLLSEYKQTLSEANAKPLDNENIKSLMDKTTLLNLRIADLRYENFNSQYYNSLTLPLGIKMQKGASNTDYNCFNGFEKNEAIRNTFDTLPDGTYYLSFNTTKSAHAVAFVKYSFGSYILDPNFGLMKASSAQTLLTLLKFYNPAKDCLLKAYRYGL